MKRRDKNDSMDFFRLKCKEHHLKATPQRAIIYKELLNSRDHPYADAMFKNVRRVFPDISFDAVNRTLLTFCRILGLSIMAVVNAINVLYSDRNYYYLGGVKWLK